MLFNKQMLLSQADAILKFLTPNLSNVVILDGRKIRSICQTAFHTGFKGQFHCTTPVRTRSVPQTVYISDSEEVRDLAKGPIVKAGQEKILAGAKSLLATVQTYIRKTPLWYYQAAVGEHRRLRSGVNLYVGATNRHDIRLLYMAWIMFPVPQLCERFSQEFTLLYLPEFENPAIFVFPDKKFTLVLGSGYFGELKKGVLRMLWYEASFRNILGLHASTKIVTTERGSQLAVVTLGLSGTGKTSTVMALQTGFQAFCQDDFVGFDLEKLGLWGTELGLFLKTEGVTTKDQPEIYEALTDPRAFWENVFVDYQGCPNFYDLALTPNGRAVTPRTALPREVVSHSIDIDLREINQVIFLMCTRHNSYPVLQRLTPEQFAAAFALGHTTGTSAGGSAEAGKEKFIEGTNPFIIRLPGHDSNLLLAGLRKLQEANIPVSCLLLNTGFTGEVVREGKMIEEAIDIRIVDCSRVLAAAWNEEIDFRLSNWLKTQIPIFVSGLSRRILDPEVTFSGHKSFYQQMISKLNAEKQQRLKAMEALSSEILEAGLLMYPTSI